MTSARSGAIGPQSARSGVWLNALQDVHAGLSTTQSLMLLTDIEAEGDSGLLVCDYEKKRIRLYLGASSEWEQRLMEIPSCIAAFKSTPTGPPLVAVGAGAYLYIYKHLKPFLKFSLPDCVCALKEIFTTDEKKTSRLIVGLENGAILVLDLTASSIHKSFSIEAPPVSMEIQGIFADYTIFVFARNQKIFRLSSSGKTEIWGVLPQPVVTSCRTSGSELYVACMGGLVLAFSFDSSKPTHTHSFAQAPVVALAPIEGDKRALVVGLRSGEVVLIVDHVKSQSLFLDTKIVSLTLGTFARESNVLLVVTASGALVTKILARGALEKAGDESAKTAVNVPKKSSAFFELVERERTNYKSMVSTFQTDLTNLKVLALEELIGLYRSKQAAVKEPSPNIKIFGMGPEYRMLVEVKRKTDNPGTLSVLLGNLENSPSAYRIKNPSQAFTGEGEKVQGVAFNFELTDLDKYSGKPLKLTFSRNGSVTLQTIVNIPESELPLLLD